jgi:hypothetical protein
MQPMEKSLDELLGGEPVETEAVAEEQEAPALQRDEHGRFAAKETGVEPEPETEPEVPPTTDKLPPDTFKAVKEEREKRQQLERQLQELQSQIQAAQQQPPAPPPSIWEDDQAALAHVRDDAVNAAVQQATFNAKLDMSEMMVRQANPDFEEVKAEFLALAAQNPDLRNQALADPHPWNKAYQIAKNARTMRELGATNVAELEAKLREQIMAEMQGQMPAQARPAVPPTLTGERNLGARTGPAWTGPKSLTELLG